jgi:hypothetical protein
MWITPSVCGGGSRCLVPDFDGASLLAAGSSHLELREADGQNLFHRHSAVGELLGQNELLRIGQVGRYHHFPTRRQLVDQRRKQIGSGRHDHLVKWGVLRPTVIAIGNLEFDIAVAQPSESFFRRLAKLIDYFNGVYLAGQPREDGGVISKTGPNFENALIGLSRADRLLGRRQMAARWSLRSRLEVVEYCFTRRVEVRSAQTHAADRRHDAFVKGALAKRKGLGGDDREYVFLQGLKVFCSHWQLSRRTANARACLAASTGHPSPAGNADEVPQVELCRPRRA